MRKRERTVEAMGERVGQCGSERRGEERRGDKGV